MSKIRSPYSIETASGSLELTKGTYLTLLRKKPSAIKTLIKSKPISHFSNNKNTVKKPLTKSYGRTSLRSSLRNEIVLKDKTGKGHIFDVCGDKELFKSRVIIPTIEMSYDNDEESDWMEIGDNVHNMSMSLSLAAFDHKFGRC